MTKLRILVLSDLHVHSKAPSDPGVPSQFSSLPRYENELHNPVRACEALLRNRKGSIDWIVCPGDLGDKNNAENKSYAWRELNWLKRKLGARHLIAAVGNHDIDSRRADPGTLPDAGVRALSPKFPIVGSGSNNGQFWQSGFVIKKFPRLDTTLCLLNSCAFHGVGGVDDEHERGRLPEDVLEQLQHRLPSSTSAINVLVMHHHAHKHPWLLNDESHAVNGIQLIEILKESRSRWLVVHGHRHLPQLWYSGAAHNSPVVLSSGSPSATPYPVRGRTTRNQMHLLTIDGSLSARFPEELFGKVRTWSWSPGVGWVRGSSSGDGLPSICGFGRSGGVDLLANEIETVFQGSAVATIAWQEIAAQHPHIDYLTPEDFEVFQNLLERKNLIVLLDRFSVPQSIQRRAN